MKVVHICMQQYSDGWTYQENMLCKYHIKLGYDVTVITSMYCFREGKVVEDTKTDFYDVNGAHVIRLKKKSEGLMHKIPNYECFSDVLANEAPDIIFSHGCQYKDASLVAKYVKKHPNVKLFVDNHADFTNSATNFISKNILHKIVWKYNAHTLLPYTEKFWGVLPARVDFLIDVYRLPKEKCELLVMGADDELVEKSNRDISSLNIRGNYEIGESDFIIVSGGKIDKAKLQTELLMKAVHRIDDSRVKLLLFGSIEEEIKERILSLVDGNKIIYAGWVTPDQSYDFFAIADLVVFPGRHSVFWEQAAGQGKPMICKNWPGTHHVDVGGNVMFLNNDSVDEIYNNIMDLINDPAKYQEMKKIAISEGMSVFSYKSIAKKGIAIQ